jgi:acetyltransferase-like isoleucine patch superfamily enzyme
MGKGVFIGRGVRFDRIFKGALITIEDDVTITSGVTILTHDASSGRRIEMTWMAPVIIGEGAFIGVDTIIMPGVRIGKRARS